MTKDLIEDNHRNCVKLQKFHLVYACTTTLTLQNDSPSNIVSLWNISVLICVHPGIYVDQTSG